MTLTELRKELSIHLPVLKRRLNTCLSNKRQHYGQAYATKDQHHVDIYKNIEKKERFLCGVVGAMNRLDDQLMRLNEVESDEFLLKGLGNDE